MIRNKCPTRVMRAARSFAGTSMSFVAHNPMAARASRAKDEGSGLEHSGKFEAPPDD